KIDIFHSLFSRPSLFSYPPKFSILQILNHCTIFQLLTLHRAKLKPKLLVEKTRTMSSSSPSPVSATFFFSNPSSIRKPRTSPFSVLNTRAMAKDLYFNHDGSTTKKLLAGVELVAELLGVTLGPKGRNVVLHNKYGPPKIVNDGETVLKEIELEDPLENVGVKLVRQAGAKTNDLAGDGSTTSVVLAHGLIKEGAKVIAAGMNPVQIARGIEKTAIALVSELSLMSREVNSRI
ncbi:hypothetical protein KIW84_022731, partial [Lathyrus oleraceus]